jgi:hypothetical protein
MICRNTTGWKCDWRKSGTSAVSAEGGRVKGQGCGGGVGGAGGCACGASAHPRPFAGGAGPRLELFARELRPGWTVWGNEVENTNKDHQ